MDSSMRPEAISAASQSIRTGSFFDLSGFKQHQEYHALPDSYYEVFTNGSTTQITMQVPAANDYLNDIEFWFKIKAANGNQAQIKNSTDVPSQMHHLIRSISIKADSRQILYVDHARYLLSIMQQRKKDSSQSLMYDFDDYPTEYAANTTTVDSNVTQGTFNAAIPLAEKQVALY